MSLHSMSNLPYTRFLERVRNSIGAGMFGHMAYKAAVVAEDKTVSHQAPSQPMDPRSAKSLHRSVAGTAAWPISYKILVLYG